MTERTCPVCSKPFAKEGGYAPFCSKRCADVDLQRWFSGRYAIPSTDAQDGPPDERDDDRP